MTNISKNILASMMPSEHLIIQVGKMAIQNLSGSYAEKPEGEPLAIIGSSGYLEISVNLGRASDRLDLEDSHIPGMEVRIRAGMLPPNRT
jgi:S-adenosylmethionine hydrolase